MHLKKRSDRGFTLIELMIAMAVALIVLAAIYRAYQTQQKAFTTQQLVVAMQQNARLAMTLMKREIRMAGYKPAASDGIDNDADCPDPSNPLLSCIDENDDDENGRRPWQQIGIMTARKDEIMFRMDSAPYDGLADDSGEEIKYYLQDNAAGDGKDLVREINDGNPPSILAYDVEAVAFGYAFDSDKDGYLDTDGTPDENVIWAYSSHVTGMTLDRNAQADVALSSIIPIVDLPPGDNSPIIGAVRIWLLARTAHPIRGELDTHTYQVGDQVIAPGTYDPAYRRTLQIATVYCRNMRF